MIQGGKYREEVILEKDLEKVVFYVWPNGIHIEVTTTTEKVRRKFSYFCFNFVGVGFIPGKEFSFCLLKTGEGEYVFDGNGFMVWDTGDYFGGFNKRGVISEK